MTSNIYNNVIYFIKKYNITIICQPIKYFIQYSLQKKLLIRNLIHFPKF